MLNQAKTSAERGKKLKAEREALGQKEIRALYCHPDDNKQIRTYVGKLNAKRQREI